MSSGRGTPSTLTVGQEYVRPTNNPLKKYYPVAETKKYQALVVASSSSPAPQNLLPEQPRLTHAEQPEQRDIDDGAERAPHNHDECGG